MPLPGLLDRVDELTPHEEDVDDDDEDDEEDDDNDDEVDDDDWLLAFVPADGTDEELEELRLVEFCN